MAKILITGTSGFIGTNLALALKDRFDLLCIDKDFPKVHEIQPFWSKIDITHFDSLNKAILQFQPDYIIHLAARTDLDGQTIEDYSANTIGVENLLKAIEGVSNLKKILITSSMLVCHAGYYPKDQFDYAPTTIYGESKVITEKTVWKYKPHCDWAILRPTSIWGPWFGVPYRNFFDMVMHRRYFHIGYKSCTKTYGYVGNAIYQIMQILQSETEDESNKVFYLGDAPATPIEDWANEIAHELGSSVMRMPWILLKLAACSGDLLKHFGFHFPMTSFRLRNMTTDNIIDLSATVKLAPKNPYSRLDGVKETIKWLKFNQ